MAKAKATSPTVVETYRAYGECRELGIHCIPFGYIEVERLSDGTLRPAGSADTMVAESETEPAPEPIPLPAPAELPTEPAAE